MRCVVHQYHHHQHRWHSPIHHHRCPLQQHHSMQAAMRHPHGLCRCVVYCCIQQQPTNMACFRNTLASTMYIPNRMSSTHCQTWKSTTATTMPNPPPPCTPPPSYKAMHCFQDMQRLCLMGSNPSPAGTHPLCHQATRRSTWPLQAAVVRVVLPPC